MKLACFGSTHVIMLNLDLTCELASQEFTYNYNNHYLLINVALKFLFYLLASMDLIQENAIRKMGLRGDLYRQA